MGSPVTWLFLAFFATQLAVEATLLVLNLRHVARARGVPPALVGRVDPAVADRSRAYTLANGRFALLSMSASAAVSLLALLSGLLPWLDRTLSGAGLGGAHLFVGFLVVLAAGSAVLGLPFSLYRTFV